MITVEAGQRWRYDAMKASNVLTNLPPYWKYLTVSFVDGDTVYYQNEGATLVKQMPKTAFVENAELVNEK